MNIVKELRLKAGIKQNKLAEIIGVSPPTVSEWESGKKDPSGERLKKLAEYFGVDELLILGKQIVVLSQNKDSEFETRKSLLSADIDLAAIKATETLIRYHVSSVPVSPLSILEHMQDVFVVSFTEMADGSGFDRTNLVTLFGAENQDAATFVKDIDGQKKYVVAYNQSLPTYITQRALARELGHIILGHDSSISDSVQTTEALYFARHILSPRPLIKMLQEAGITPTIKVFGNVTGCYGRYLAGIRKTPGANVPAELNRIARMEFDWYVKSFVQFQTVLCTDDDSAIADFGTYMDNYVE